MQSPRIHPRKATAGHEKTRMMNTASPRQPGGYRVAPGDYYLSYTVHDVRTGDESQSPELTVHVKLDINITVPSADAKYTYSDASPGLLTIACQAATDPAAPAYEDKIQWSMTEIIGSDIKADDHKGYQTSFEYQRLPALNDQFGEKLIIAAIPEYGVADTVKVKIFYPKNATNNPGNNNEPNWYYYWKQTIAGKDPSIYGGGDCSDTTNGYFVHWQYESAETYFHICDNAANFSCFKDECFYGIDNFGKTSLHEYFHYQSWWLFYGGPSPKYTSADDPDRDYIPTEVEIAHHSDPNSANTFYPNINDWELYAIRYSLDTWVIGSADLVDWANPGHQY